MKTVCKLYFWCPNLDKEIKSYVKNCSACLEYRYEPMVSSPISWKDVAFPMSKVHVDFFELKKKIF